MDVAQILITHLQVVTEISKALSSVMTDKDFENFGALEPHNRLESLKEIRMIVCGIVLFNKDTGICSAMDQNIPDRKSFVVNCCSLFNQSCLILLQSFSDKESG